MKPISPICPKCGRPVATDAENIDKPFCSRRCRLSDLGAWVSGEHRIAGDPVETPDAMLGDAEDDSLTRH